MFNIFEIAGNNEFFSILARPSKEVYWAIMNLLYDEVMSIYEIRISRSEARFLIEKYFSKNKEMKEICAMEPHALLSVYLETGWMTQRYDGEEGDDFLYFTPFALNFLKTMEDSENMLDSIRSEDYLTRIYAIATDILDKNEQSDAYKYPFRNGIGKIVRLLNDCFYHLSTIEQQTTEDVKNILEIKDLQELIDKLKLYIDDLNSGYIHDVYEGFNLTEMYRKKMLKLIDEISEETELREKVLIDMKEKYQHTNKEKTDEELAEILKMMLNKLENKIVVSYPAYKARIDAGVQNLISKSLHKMNMLSEGGASHVSTLNRVIDLLISVSNAEKEDLYEQDETIQLLFAKSANYNRIKLVDEESLFKKRDIAPKDEMEPVIEVEVDDDEEIDLAKLETKHFNLEDTNKHVKRLLGTCRAMKASDLDFDDDTVEQLQAACLLSDMDGAEYEIEFTGELVEKDGYEFDEFVLRKI